MKIYNKKKKTLKKRKRKSTRNNANQGLGYVFFKGNKQFRAK